MLEDVIARLRSLGYTGGVDSWELEFLIVKTEHYIENYCNISSVPDELREVAVDMVCGEFLFEKKQGGQTGDFPLDFDAAVKQVSEGDTSVTYAVGDGSQTAEQRFDKLIAYLRTGRSAELIKFRKLAW